MKNYKYNWATAEIMKMYLKNSRAQGARKDRAVTVTEVSTDTQEALATGNDGLTMANDGLTTANDDTGASQSGGGVLDSDSDSSDEDN